MDAIDIVGHRVEEFKANEEGPDHDSRIHVETPSSTVAITNSESSPLKTEYEQALEDMGRIVNSSDNTFKRKYVGVIWKNLTVRSRHGAQLIF